MEKLGESNTSKKCISIKFKLIVSYVLLAAIPLIIVNIISTTSFRKSLRDTSMKLTTQMVSQTNANINYFTSDIEKNVAKFILNNLNSTTGDNLINGFSSSSGVEQIKYRNPITSELNGISVFEDNIKYAVLLTKDGTEIGASKKLTDKQIAEILKIKIPDEGLWYRNKALGDQLFYIKKIRNSISGVDFGYFIGEIKLDTIQGEIDSINLFDNAVISIVDEKYEILCGSQDRVIKEDVKQFIAGRKPLDSQIISDEMIAYATGQNNWQIIVRIPINNLTSSVDSINTLVWILVIIIGVMAIIIGYLISKGFTSSISDLVKAMKKTEKGDLTVSVPIRSKDEMASLCESFNNMICNIKHLISQTHTVIGSSVSSGNILSNSTKQSVEAFSQLAVSINEVAKGSTKQAEDALDSSMVMNELSESIQKVRKNTQNLFESTENAKTMIENATDSIETLNTTMASSIKVSDKIKTSIIELGIMTKNIEQIMRLVDGISEQTNLLALNASIEAARAGEVGRGFAVVAKEVRNLSEQSKSSTRNVRSTLQDIEDKSTDTVALVTKANKIFSQQAVAVERTYDVFKQIIQRLIDMDKELGFINSQVIDMQKLKDTMSDKIERITTVTEENASAAQEVNALSEEQKEVMRKLSALSVELVSTMQQLEESINYFRV